MRSGIFRFRRRKKDEEQPLTAAALKYDPDEDHAPRVIARGERKLAERILAEAQKHDIEVVEDPVLSAALAQLNPGEEIPEELYPVVAEVLAFLYRVTHRSRSSGG